MEYYSHRMTDRTDPVGIRWGDTALVLCRGCAKATDGMTLVAEFILFSEQAKEDRQNKLKAR